jgi:hypothetical protein
MAWSLMRRNAFLGLVNFYRRFVPAAAKLLLPLTAVLSGGPAGSSKVKWSPGMVAAFKAAVAAACELQHPAPSAELSLATDASASHIAAVLQQHSSCHGAWQPLAFYSAKLSPAQINNSTFDRELLAVYEAVRHFWHMLEGRAFVIFTDHKLLVGGINRVSDPWSARQQRQLSYIAEFAATLRHISGESNVVADALSRPAAQQQQPAVNNVAPAAAPAVSPPLDIRELAAAQSSCADCQRAATSPSLRVVTANLDSTPLLVDVSSGVFRPLVPGGHRRQIFEAVHNLAHPGYRATRRLIASRYV